MDDSCDITHKAELSIFVHFLDKMRDTFIEKILVILQLTGRTGGEDMIEALMDYFIKNSQT